MVKIKMIPFLEPEEIDEKGEIAKITGPGVYTKINTPHGEKEVLRVPILINDDVKRIYTMNLTSQVNIARIYGDDTEKWVGKHIKLKVERMKVGKNVRDVIFAEPVKVEKQGKLLKEA